MSVWTNIKDWFKNVFNKLVKIAKQFIKDAFNQIQLVTIAEFKDFAIEVIKDLASTDLTDDQKRAKAFERVQNEAAQRGASLKTSVINVLIELTVQYLKRRDEI